MASSRDDAGGKTAYQEWLGLSMESGSPESVVMSIPYDEKLTNPYDVINGGIITTLIDLSSGRLFSLQFDEDETYSLATIDLDVRFLAPATGDLYATAELVDAGGSIGVTRVDVEAERADGSRELVAIGTTTYRIFRE